MKKNRPEQVTSSWCHAEACICVLAPVDRSCELRQGKSTSARGLPGNKVIERFNNMSQDIIHLEGAPLVRRTAPPRSPKRTKAVNAEGTSFQWPGDHGCASSSR